MMIYLGCYGIIIVGIRHSFSPFFMLCLQLLLVVGFTAPSASAVVPPFPPHLVGEVDAVVALLERVLGAGGSEHFSLSIQNDLQCKRY